MFIYFDKISGTEVRRGKYNRNNIDEPIEGEHSVTVYKLLDVLIDCDPDYQRKNKTTLDISEDLYKGLEHIKIAYQNYEVVDFPDEQKISIFSNKFGSWIDQQYPVYKRQKHSDELVMNPTAERKADIESWKAWEFSQRDLFDQKKINKDFNFNFEPKNI